MRAVWAALLLAGVPAIPAGPLRVDFGLPAGLTLSARAPSTLTAGGRVYAVVAGRPVRVARGPGSLTLTARLYLCDQGRGICTVSTQVRAVPGGAAAYPFVVRAPGR